jgi:hypothetical protein
MAKAPILPRNQHGTSSPLSPLSFQFYLEISMVPHLLLVPYPFKFPLLHVHLQSHPFVDSVILPPVPY